MEDTPEYKSVYETILRGDVTCLNNLLDSWRCRLNLEDMDIFLSAAYSDLKLKNVALSVEIQTSVQCHLVELRFYSRGDMVPTPNLVPRLQMLFQVVNSLPDDHSVDSKFLYKLKFIARTLLVLKQNLKATYTDLPWEEMLFCLVMYVSSQTTRSDLNVIFRSVLKKSSVLKNLNFFVTRLRNLQSKIEAGGDNLNSLIRSTRDAIVEAVVQAAPEFGQLYADYDKVRDVYSLKEAARYMNGALGASPTTSNGRLALERALQATGELLKSTAESPHLSAASSATLLQRAPAETRLLLATLRNSLSHARRVPRVQQNFYDNIKNDIKKIEIVISQMLYTQKMRHIAEILNNIILCQNLDEINEMFDAFEDLSVLDNPSTSATDQNTREQRRIEVLLEDISSNIVDKTDDEEKYLKEVRDIVNVSQDFQKTLHDYRNGSTFLKRLSEYVLSEKYHRIGERNIINIKTACSEILKKVLPNSAKFLNETFEIFTGLLIKFYESVQSRISEEDNKELLDLIFQVHHLFAYEKNSVRWIDEFKERLNKSKIKKLRTETSDNTNNIQINPRPLSQKQKKKRARELKAIEDAKIQHDDKVIMEPAVSEKTKTTIEQIKTVNKNESTPESSSLKDVEKEMLEKISTLKEIFNSNSSENGIPLISSDYDKLAVEMLVLDILTALDTAGTLVGSVLFVEDCCPVLTGRGLRNLLAHGNPSLDTLYPQTFVSVLSNAKFLIENTITFDKKIGKIVSDNFTKLEQQYNKDIFNLEKQDLLCKALDSGHFKSVKTCLNKGSDLNYRSLNLWTSLHRAAAAPSIQVVVHLITNHHLNFMAVDSLGQNALHIAASRGRTYIARALIEIGGMRLDTIDNFKRTPLYCASQNGFSETVCELISLGADCTSTDEFGLNPLHCAIKNNHINVVKVLLSYGCFDVNSHILNTRGTSLHYASEYGYTELVNLLLDFGANVNAVCIENSTPLSIAASHGYLETVKVLIKRGAKVNLMNFSSQRSPLHNAIQPWDNSKEVVKVLLESGAFVDDEDKSCRQTPLHLASFIGQIEIIKQLIECHANVNATRYNNMTPLMCASHEGHVKAVDFLIENGALLNMQDDIGYTALHIAAMNGHTDVVKSLIAHGIDVNSKSNNQITPLHLAAKTGKPLIVQILLAEGANVNCTHKGGMTPLHESSYEVHEASSEILIMNGADVNAKNVTNMTPLNIAMEKPCTDELIHLLISNGADVNTKSISGSTPLHRACYFGHVDVVKYLIHANADVHSKTDDDITPLIVAVENNHKEIAGILLDHGAVVSAVKGDGCTALCCAAKYNYKEIANLLIERGADVNAQGGGPLINAIISGHRNFFDILLKNEKLQLDVSDYEGNTPLHLAARNGNWNIGKELIKRGVNINSLNKDNMTPLWLAVYQNHKEFVDLLLENNASIDSEPKDCLYTAVLGSYVEIVESLLRSGAKNNRHERNGYKTTLELAVINGSLDIIKLFFKYQNIDVNKEDDMHNTMLHIAANQGYIDIIEFLLDNGADWDHRNIGGLKPLHVAANQARFGSMEYFFKRGMNVNDVDPFGITILHYVANIGQSEAANILLGKGALVNAVTNTQLCPIHLAAMRGHKAVVNILLNGGAIYDAEDNAKKQPKDYTTNEDILSVLISTADLFIAVKENNVTAVKSSITLGGSVNAKNKDFLTPLHIAIKEGNKRICEILLQNRANPNSLGNGNRTPLHYAVKYSQLEITKALLSNGAMYNVKNDESKTPMDLCKEENIKDLFQLISRLFEMVSNSDVILLRELNEIKEMEIRKTVMRTRNAQNESIVVLAIQKNFPKLDELKEVFQDQIFINTIVYQDLTSSGRYTQALIVLNRLLEQRRNIMGIDNPANLDLEREIATIFYYQSRYSEALSLQKVIYGRQKELLGRSHEATIRTRTSVALLLSKLDQPQVALKTFEEIYEMQKEILGDDHEDTLHTKMYTASTLAILGRKEEALNLNIQTYETCLRVLGSKHALTSSVHNNTAAVYSSRKEFEPALRIFRMVYEAKFFGLGPDHSDTMKALHNIASALAGVNQYDEAVILFLYVLEYQVIRLGPSHLDTIATRNKLAGLLFKYNKNHEAKHLLAEGYKRMNKKLGSKHPEVKNLRKVLEDLGYSLCTNNATENIATDDTKSNEELNLFEAMLSDNETNLSKNPASRIEEQHVNLENDDYECHVDISGNTTLLMATLYKNCDFVSKLLENNCLSKDPKEFRDIIDAKSIIWDATPLHIAVKNGSFEIVQLLLDYGARSDIVDSEGKKPVDYSKNEEITKLLDMVCKQREGTRRDEIISNYKERWGLAELTTIFGAKINRLLARRDMAQESEYENLVNLFIDAKDEDMVEVPNYI